VCVPFAGVGEGQEEEGHANASEHSLGGGLGDQGSDVTRDGLADGVTEFGRLERFHGDIVNSKAHKEGEEAMEPAVEEQRTSERGSEWEDLASTFGLGSVNQT